MNETASAVFFKMLNTSFASFISDNDGILPVGFIIEIADNILTFEYRKSGQSSMTNRFVCRI